MIPTRPTIRLVYDRKHQATKSAAKERKTGLVQIEVMHQRKRRYISTGVKVYTDQWRQNHEQHVVGSVYADQYNNTIANAMRSVMDAVDRQVAAGAIDLATLGQQTIGSTSVADYARSVVDCSTIAASTRKAYKYIIDTMADFPQFSNIAKVTRRDVDSYMAIVVKKRQTTQKNYISMLHRTFRAALDAGVIASDPSAHVGYPRQHVSERARLTDDEVAAIAAAELPADLESARDLFLWQCYTGMAWVDCATLTSDMITTEGGHIYITRSRQKTRVQYRTMLLKPAAAILRKYGGTLPKMVSYTYYHRHLQRIAKAAGITKHVTSHVGRHTFATWALSHGVPIEIVSKMLGHTNIETTQIYAKILAKDVDAQFERLDGLF